MAVIEADTILKCNAWEKKNVIRISLKCVPVLWTAKYWMVSARLFIWHFSHPVYLLVLFRINFP